MRIEKEILAKQYLERLNSSPFFIVVNYQGLKVGPMNDLRRRLEKVGAEIHVVKNSVFKRALHEANLPEFDNMLTGQLAVVTGQKDISAAAKVLKTFAAEFERPKMRFGYLHGRQLDEIALNMLAELPSLDTLRATLLGLLNAPATNLVRLLMTPSTQLARVLQARVDKGV